MRVRRFLFVLVAVLAIVVIALAIQPIQSARPMDSSESPQSSITTIITDTIAIPTYPYASYLFTKTDPTYNIPYPVIRWANYQDSHPQPANKSYTRLTLENEWLHVSLLPELGGRIYEMIFKPTGNNELYRNPVIKPTHWGPPIQGWWLAAGGIEWGLPVEEHGYESALPWAYDIVNGTDGITVTLRDSTQPDRLRAAVTVFLPNDRAVLIIHPRLENDRNVPLDFKWWINAMLAPGPGNSVGKQGTNPNGTDLRFVYPETQVTVHSTGDPTLPAERQAMAWPIYKGRDMSRLQNWNQWLGFFARPSASQNFVSVYDLAHREGLARIFPRNIAQGSKGFAMGWLNPIGAGEWTDDDSFYVELHGGLAPTFWDSVSIGAHQAIEWEEVWYPLAGLGDVSAANGEAALHVASNGATLTLGAYATRAHDHARLLAVHRATCNVLLDESLTNVTPAQAITRTLATSLPPSEVAVALTADQSTLIDYNVVDNAQPPNISLQTINPYITQTTIPITLTVFGGDCVRSWDAQVKDGLYGTWTAWLTDTTQITQTYTGTPRHTYSFRARARDLSGNQSTYHSEMLGDAFTTVLLTPAPVLELSYKLAPQFISPGQSIEYTIISNNTGNFPATATLTDTLPVSATLITGTLNSSFPPAPVIGNRQIIWSGVIPTGTGVEINYSLAPAIDLPPGAVLTNTVKIAGGVVPVTRSSVVVNPHRVFLPVILR